MNDKQLWTALHSLFTARTPEEFDEVIFRQPELLEEGTLRSIQALAMVAREQGDAQSAAGLKQLAMMLMSAVQNIGEAVAKPIEMEPVTPETSVVWARLTREYLARREDELFDEAVSAAQRAGEKDIVALLQHYRNQDQQQIDSLIEDLFRTFRPAGRQEEATRK